MDSEEVALRFSLVLSGSIVLWLLGLGWAVAADPSQWGPTTSASAPIPPTIAVPASLAGDGVYTSGCVPVPYARAFTVMAAMAGASTVSVQRYVDQACTLPMGAAIPSSPLALTQGGGCPGSTYCGDDSVNDGFPFSGIVVTVTDTSNATNAVTAIVLLAGAE